MGKIIKKKIVLKKNLEMTTLNSYIERVVGNYIAKKGTPATVEQVWYNNCLYTITSIYDKKYGEFFNISLVKFTKQELETHIKK